MKNLPTSTGNALAPASGIVRAALQALHAFEGEPLTRGQAQRLLSMWVDRDLLSDAQRAAVLAQFPETPGNEPGRLAPRHAYVVTRGHDDYGTTVFYWQCACGTVLVQGPGEQETIVRRLLAHIECEAELGELGGLLTAREAQIRRRLDGLQPRPPLRPGRWLDGGSGPGWAGPR